MENKDRKFKATYRIGEIANMLGMHPQTIRYYDKVGIVLPSEKKQKNERLYASYDVYKIMVRKQYQNMGFSIEETEKIFNENDLEQLAGNLSEKIEETERELQKKQFCLEGMKQFKELVESIPVFYKRCFHRVLPGRWHHLHLREDILENSDNGTLARKIAMEAMPLCRHTLAIKQSDIETKPNPVSTYCDLTMDAPSAEFFGFDQIPTSFYVEPRACIYTIFKVDSYDTVKWSYLDYAEQFMADNRLELNGDVQLVTIANALQAGGGHKERYRYFEAWIPFRDKVQ
ncbi:MAG: helix-turn-helix transcriptional regulator, MerR family [Paenibacillaceae bacterium]|jgi:DNA-binding transcriptional MerR regulator|nr:helix-turn-helix transcriptional regulator, MerR family [Paenibacillaceae bacterium]